MGTEFLKLNSLRDELEGEGFHFLPDISNSFWNTTILLQDNPQQLLQDNLQQNENVPEQDEQQTLLQDDPEQGEILPQQDEHNVSVIDSQHSHSLHVDDNNNDVTPDPAAEISISSDSQTGGVKPYSCTKCHKSYQTKRSLSRHSRIHDDSKELPCSFCHKVYFVNYDLKQHVMSHLKASFDCMSCSKSFKSKSGLNAHKREHLGFFKYVCEVCGKGFNFKSEFSHHKARHEDTKPFQCNSCTLKFRSPSNLVRHAKICGNKERRFKCDVCDRKFKAKRYLADHTIAHSNPERYQCSVCGNFFKYKCSFYKHRRKTGHK